MANPNNGPRPEPRTVTFTNSTLDPDLRSTINELLLNNNCIPVIHATLLHECQASGFVEQVRVRAMDLLRTGKATSFSDCMEQIMQTVKIEGEDANGTTGSAASTKASEKEGSVDGGADSTILVPKRVVKEGRDVLMQQLEPYLEFGEKGGA